MSDSTAKRRPKTTTFSSRRGHDAPMHLASPPQPWSLRREIGAFFFAAASPLITAGSRGLLEPSQLLDIEDNERAETLSWILTQVLSRQETPNLWKALYSILGASYIRIALFAVVSAMCKLSSAIILGRFILYLQDSSAPATHGILFGGILGLSMLTFALVESQFMIRATRLGIRARVAVVAALYDRILTAPMTAQPPAGHLLNIVSNDAQRLEDAAPFLIFLVLAPLETVVAFITTTYIIGLQASLAAFGTLAALILLLATNQQRFNRLRKQLVEARDHRIKIVADMVKHMEVVKMMAWSDAFVARALRYRAQEMAILRRWYLLKGFSAASYWSSAGFMGVAGFFVYYFLQGHTLQSDVVFTSLLLFTSVRTNMAWRIPKTFELIAELRVSIARIEHFLTLEPREALHAAKQVSLAEPSTDGVTEPAAQSHELARLTSLPMADSQETQVEGAPVGAIEFTGAHISWSPNAPVLQNVTLSIPTGQMTALVGQIGAGKSSLLNAVLGHMYRTQGTITIAAGSTISFAGQSAFLTTGTVRENILMGADEDTARLERMVRVCQLKADVARWEQGLDTPLGERGSRASGGQRARIALCRACYQDADIYLLDDVFSALDAHVAEAIFRGLQEEMASKTVVLASHQLRLVAKCPNVVFLRQGRVVAEGSFGDVMRVADGVDPPFAAILRESAVEHPRRPSTSSAVLGGVDIVPGGGAVVAVAGSSAQHRAAAAAFVTADEDDMDADIDSLADDIDAEHAALGMDYSVIPMFLRSAGNGHWLLLAALILGLTSCSIQAVSDWWLSVWASTAPEVQLSSRHWVLILVLSCTIPTIAYSAAAAKYFVVLKASEALFARMLRNLTRATPRWLQLNGAGRILNRIGKDMTQIDEVLPDAFQDVLITWIYCSTIMVVTAIAVPYILIAMVPIVTVFVWLRARYVAANRQIRRMEALARSPVYAHLVSTAEGVVTVTALGRENQYFGQFCGLLDDHTRALVSFFMVERWLCLHVDALACMIIFCTSGLMIAMKSSLGIGIAALAQMYVLSLVDVTQYNVRKTAELELMFVSVERVFEYATDIPLESEAATLADLNLAPNWPDRGVIELDHMNLKYNGSESYALKDVSLTTSPGEMIGICGRSGSGKSSTINALFRMAEAEEPGSIRIDGVDISQLALDDLRARLSIIPQSVFLFHGSVRENLDPVGVHPDAKLWEVLRQVELADVISALPLRLDNPPQLSAGEGQLLQLARVLLRSGKVVVLDECTSNIDQATDRAMQRIIRSQFIDRGCTVLVIAHRVETIAHSHRILVLDSGSCVELDRPETLLMREDGQFRKLAEKGVPKETFEALLVAAARAAAANVPSSKPASVGE
ncbi:P-loop containing nucleoside triphosphate hydrolase protein [Blastocladiella britannica]|nr:P-loop containing nucleoside triphosphate hydrolase protein [Blastocladiella britannica]